MSLTGRLLLAKPELVDHNFDGTVTLVLAHDADGAMGVVLNRPGPAADVLGDRWGTALVEPGVVFAGGPVGPDSIVALAHHPEMPGPLPHGLRSIDPSGADEHPGPIARVRLFNGYAGWGPGQLDGELAAGAWWLAEGSAALTFDPEPLSMWRRLVRSMGADRAIWSTWTPDPSVN